MPKILRIIDGKNGRGFRYKLFKDMDENECSIAETSVEEEDCIWFGIDEPKIVTAIGNKPVQLPEGVEVLSRMHLSREQVSQLIPILQKFADTGHL